MLRDCQPAKGEDGLFTIKDVENGLTGSSSLDDVTLVKHIPFHVTSKCKVRDSWNMAYCPYNYGEVSTFHLNSRTFILVVYFDKSDYCFQRS